MTMYHYCEIEYRHLSFLMKQMGKAGLSGLPLGLSDDQVIDMHESASRSPKRGLFLRKQSFSSPDA